MQLILFLAIIFFSIPANATLRIDITKGSYEPMPVAIAHFSGTGTNKELGIQISDVVQADLERSGLFTPISRNAFIGEIKTVSQVPKFADWRVIDAQVLLVGDVVKTSNGNIKVNFRAWDVFSGKQYVAGNFSAPPKNWRRIAHKIADEVYKRLTGEGAYFDSRIVYVAQDGHWKKPRKRLAIMEQDGANHVYLTSGKSMVLSPRFDPTSQRIIYMAYYGKSPSVYIYNLQTGEEKLLGKFKGMSYAPRFSPDGKKVVLSVANKGSSDIYVIELSSGKRTQLTSGWSIDTSPSFSADGQKIVFNSDRSGKQHLYIMDIDGDGVRKISNGKGSYATPVWSPRGDLIAFTKMYKGKFHIGIIRPDGTGERILTESYLDEGPTWSPNGRVIIFSRQTRGSKNKSGSTKLYSIDLTGHNERIVPTTLQAIDPAWGPLLR